MDKAKASQMPATTLAFIGDAVFTLYVRTVLSLKHDYKTGQLSKRSAQTVSAVSQSKLLGLIEPLLDQDEINLLKRCRNAHTNNFAKNASIGEYHRATGLEGLLGFLYLTDKDRLYQLLEKMLAE